MLLPINEYCQLNNAFCLSVYIASQIMLLPVGACRLSAKVKEMPPDNAVDCHCVLPAK